MLSSEIVAENLVRLTNLIKDIAEFTSQDIVEVGRRMGCADKTLAQMWLHHRGTSEEFYKHNTEILFDLAMFNLSMGYAIGKLSPLSGVRDERVLDIGCGIGTACILLSEQENEVTGYDINEVAIDFCNFKKIRYDLPITFTTRMPRLSRFDLVVCIDLFEHIEDLESFIQMLGSGMKVGSRLYHNEPAREELHIETHHPQHFDHTDKIEGYLWGAGFNVKSRIWAVKV